MSERDAIEELSELFVFLADNDFAGYSPLYEQIARVAATDRKLLEFIAKAANPNARRGRIPILFFAATHDRVLANSESPIAAVYRGESQADPMPLLRELLERESAEITTNMRTRSVQTNEVGRSAILSFAFSRAQRNVTAQTALFEIGPSAGLNLYFDRFHTDITRNGEFVAANGPEESTVRLQCELRGPVTPTFLTDRFAPTSRRGLDPNPIDVMNDSECRWLRACLWPGIPDRPERLAAAIDVARLSPPQLIAGDADSYRSREERTRMRQEGDPIQHTRAKLEAAGVAVADLDRARKEADDEMAEILAAVRADPMPPASAALDYVFVGA